MRKRDTREIYALKSMVKNAMVLKNQVGHLRDERDLLAAVGDKWIVGLFFSFQDEHNLYMVRSSCRQPSRSPSLGCWAGPSPRSGCSFLLSLPPPILRSHPLLPSTPFLPFTLFPPSPLSLRLLQVMEYLPGGDLMALLMKLDTFTEEATRQYMAEVAMAINSVHELGYIHRDLKPGEQTSLARYAARRRRPAAAAATAAHPRSFTPRSPSLACSLIR